jgi:hypothetical protein
VSVTYSPRDDRPSSSSPTPSHDSSKPLLGAETQKPRGQKPVKDMVTKVTKAAASAGQGVVGGLSTAGKAARDAFGALVVDGGGALAAGAGALVIGSP